LESKFIVIGNKFIVITTYFKSLLGKSTTALNILDAVQPAIASKVLVGRLYDQWNTKSEI